MSVNVSGKQVAQADFVGQIQQVLLETGLDPRHLKLELTESAVMENAERAASLLKHLKSVGVQLSVDDFGTGYSSLGYLHRFPLDTEERPLVHRSHRLSRVEHRDRATVSPV